MRCFILPLLVITVLVGCAPHTERAVRQTERISELAQSSAARFQRIEDEATAVAQLSEIELLRVIVEIGHHQHGGIGG